MSRSFSLIGANDQTVRQVGGFHALRDVFTDKLLASISIELEGVRCPVTLLATDALKLHSHELHWIFNADTLIVRGRYCHLKSTNLVARVEDIARAVHTASGEVRDRNGNRPSGQVTPEDLLVVQPYIRGEAISREVVANLLEDHVATLTWHHNDSLTDSASALSTHATPDMTLGNVIQVELIRDESDERWLTDIAADAASSNASPAKTRLRYLGQRAAWTNRLAHAVEREVA